jgi:hypothetical protein
MAAFEDLCESEHNIGFITICSKYSNGRLVAEPSAAGFLGTIRPSQLFLLPVGTCSASCRSIQTALSSTVGSKNFSRMA